MSDVETGESDSQKTCGRGRSRMAEPGSESKDSDSDEPIARRLRRRPKISPKKACDDSSSCKEPKTKAGNGRPKGVLKKVSKKKVNQRSIHSEIIIFPYHHKLKPIFGSTLWIEIFEEIYGVCITRKSDCELNISGIGSSVLSAVSTMKELVVKYNKCRGKMHINNERPLVKKLVNALKVCRCVDTSLNTFDGIPDSVITFLLSLLQKAYKENFPVCDNSPALEGSVVILDTPEKKNISVIVLSSDSEDDSRPKCSLERCSSENILNIKENLEKSCKRERCRSVDVSLNTFDGFARNIMTSLSLMLEKIRISRYPEHDSSPSFDGSVLTNHVPENNKLKTLCDRGMQVDCNLNIPVSPQNGLQQSSRVESSADGSKQPVAVNPNLVTASHEKIKCGSTATVPAEQVKQHTAVVQQSTYAVDTEVQTEPAKVQVQPSITKIQPVEVQIQHTEAQIQHTEAQIQHTEAQIQHTEAQIQPTEERIQPAVVQIRPTEKRIQPAVVQIQPTEERIQPTAVQIRPAEQRIKPAAVQIRPIGEQIQSAKEEIRPTEGKLHPFGDQIQHAGIAIHPAGVFAEAIPTAPRQGLRPVVIDGCNVAFYNTRGVDEEFSWKRIEISMRYFRDRGHTDVRVMIPHHRRALCYRKAGSQSYIDELEHQGTVVFTPSRKINGRTISCYDDRFIVDLADRNGGVILSNDNYRDIMMENVRWERTIKERLLMFVFVDDELMIPEDPLGLRGPRLKDFLAFPVQRTAVPFNRRRSVFERLF